MVEIVDIIELNLSSIEVKVIVAGKTKTMVMNCSYDQFMEGERKSHYLFVQDAFSFLSPEEKEFLVSGITLSEWNDAFGKRSK